MEMLTLRRNQHLLQCREPRAMTAKENESKSIPRGKLKSCICPKPEEFHKEREIIVV